MSTPDLSLPPYFGYIGSKSSLADELKSFMPPEVRAAYCEMFGGGLGLFLKMVKGRVTIVNDIDGDLIDTHTTVAGDPEGVMAELKKLRPSRRTFERLRNLRDSAAWHSLTPAARAASLIYITKCSVNGNMRYFSMSSKTNSNFNPDFDLRPYAEKFNGVLFENLHWTELLHRLVFKPKEVAMALYCDPPYVTADTEKHYRFNFDSVEHILLARALTRATQLNDGDRRNVKIMVSYDDDPDGFIRSLYRREFGWRIETIKVRYASEHRLNRCRNELLIMNYDPPKGISEGAVEPGEVPSSQRPLAATAA